MGFFKLWRFAFRRHLTYGSHVALALHLLCFLLAVLGRHEYVYYGHDDDSVAIGVGPIASLLNTDIGLARFDPVTAEYASLESVFIDDANRQQESIALASMARDDPPASSTASSTAAVLLTAAAMRGKVGSEFETQISYNAPMHFRHRQTDTDIVA